MVTDQFAVLQSWKEYMRLQDESSEVPIFRDKVSRYVRNDWTPTAAWNDFRKILERFRDEIVCEGGRLKFNIPNFRGTDFSFGIFSRIMFEMREKYLSDIAASDANPSVDLTRLVESVKS